MSMHFYLYCASTGECVEALAHVGNRMTPRLDANAMGAFLLYQKSVAADSTLRLIEVDSLPDGRLLAASLAEVEEERVSVGDFPGYQPPILVWSASNYREFLGRQPALIEVLDEFEASAGIWRLSSDN